MTAWDAVIFAYGVGWATTTLRFVQVGYRAPLPELALRHYQIAARSGNQRHVVRGWRIGIWINAMLISVLWPFLVTLKILTILMVWIRRIG